MDVFLSSILHKSLTISAYGQEVSIPTSSLGDGVIGIMLVFDNKEDAESMGSYTEATIYDN